MYDIAFVSPTRWNHNKIRKSEEFRYVINIAFKPFFIQFKLNRKKGLKAIFEPCPTICNVNLLSVR